MAEQEGKQALMIQLPWTVPQQENNQAMILQQPNKQKVYLDLNHSTDTTAIWSFVIAMIVALILGISATIIAIWYGRKSFDLTRQSFDTVVEQIKSSSEVHQIINSKLIESQSKNKMLETFETRVKVIVDLLSELHSMIERHTFETNSLSAVFVENFSKNASFNYHQNEFYIDRMRDHLETLKLTKMKLKKIEILSSVYFSITSTSLITQLLINLQEMPSMLLNNKNTELLCRKIDEINDELAEGIQEQIKEKIDKLII